MTRTRQDTPEDSVEYAGAKTMMSPMCRHAYQIQACALKSLCACAGLSAMASSPIWTTITEPFLGTICVNHLTRATSCIKVMRTSLTGLSLYIFQRIKDEDSGRRKHTLRLAELLWPMLRTSRS